jgi:tetratricopeptide (TPR) repeat protein
MNLAQTLAAVNEHDTALKHAEKALKLSPKNLKAQYTYGTILAQLGQVDAAVRHFEGIIRKHRQCGEAYDHLARLKKFSREDKGFIDKAEKELKRGMPAKDRLCLHFALGKIHDDCRDWNAAFDHYQQGNLLRKRKYDLKPEQKNFVRLKKLFSASTMREFQEMGNPSETPVFIVGMPRSGTTLMERMIASCDNAAGAGELPEIPRIAKALCGPPENRDFTSTLRKNLTAENISRYADEYLAILKQAGPTADRVVDKLPGNFYYLWLISILFPNATILHAMRHPLDVCLSCYFQNFTSLFWTCDLPLVGEVYRFHREVMDHWSSILPEGKVVPVHYERLVDEPENYGKQMLEHCGLEWRGDGLATYKKERVVKTASLWQVRQPVYQSSKMRWINYAPHLEELAKQLSDFLQEDRDELARHNIDISAPSGLKRLRRIFS